MAPDAVRTRLHTNTGRRRMRVVKSWFGYKVIVEAEAIVAYAYCPSCGVASRVRHEWLKVPPLEAVGTGFYNNG